MKQVKYLSAAVLLALSGAAQADVTSTITLTSDYDFRGFSQTGESPAVQLSIDYGHESGFYVGAWGSNVDSLGAAVDVSDPTDVQVSEAVGFTDGGGDSASTEVDVYAGFKMSLGDVGLDLGAVYYTYAGASDLNFAEVYAKASFNVLSAGVYYSNDFGGKASGDSSDAAVYAYADVAIPVGPVSLLAHAGVSDGDGIEAALGGSLGPDESSYTDYAAGLSYSASGFTTSMKYVFVDGSDYSDDRILLTISAGLPLPK